MSDSSEPRHGAPSSSPETLAEWFCSPLGAYAHQRELAYFDRTVADIFGYVALQVSLPGSPFLGASRILTKITLDADEPADVCALPEYLPFAENTFDLVVLPHALEFTDDPHQALREVYRVLRPEGQLVLAGFNPFSLWGLKRYFGREVCPPWNGTFIGLYRIKDWLSLLGFEIVGGQLDCYVPPFGSDHWLKRFAFFEEAGDRWWPIAGGVYFLHATKRVAGMRLITPSWQKRQRRKKALATAARSVHDFAMPGTETPRVAATQPSKEHVS